jgi:hypothetical protein
VAQFGNGGADRCSGLKEVVNAAWADYLVVFFLAAFNLSSVNLNAIEVGTSPSSLSIHGVS